MLKHVKHDIELNDDSETRDEPIGMNAEQCTDIKPRQESFAIGLLCMGSIEHFRTMD